MIEYFVNSKYCLFLRTFCNIIQCLNFKYFSNFACFKFVVKYFDNPQLLSFSLSILSRLSKLFHFLLLLPYLLLRFLLLNLSFLIFNFINLSLFYHHKQYLFVFVFQSLYKSVKISFTLYFHHFTVNFILSMHLVKLIFQLLDLLLVNIA